MRSLEMRVRYGHRDWMVLLAGEMEADKAWGVKIWPGGTRGMRTTQFKGGDPQHQTMRRLRGLEWRAAWIVSTKQAQMLLSFHPIDTQWRKKREGRRKIKMGRKLLQGASEGKRRGVDGRIDSH